VLPLEAVKVLDLTRLLPGPFCSLILADYGAEVIKIEQPGYGDYARWAPPLIKDTSSFYLLVNRNKKSLTLNLNVDKGREIFLQLARDADVILEGFRPGVAKKLGVDYDTIKKINPRLVYCSISGYGQDGPYANLSGHDVNYLSYSGILGLTVARDGTPVIPSTQIADLGGGALMATIGILLALMAQRNTGKGQFVDISMLDGLVAWLPTIAGGYFATQQPPAPGKVRLGGKYACYAVYRTKDGGYISLGALEKHFWERLCRYINRVEFIEWQFNDEKQSEIFSYLDKHFLTLNRDEWVKQLQEIDVCVAPVYSLAEVFQDSHILHRKCLAGIVIRISDNNIQIPFHTIRYCKIYTVFTIHIRFHCVKNPNLSFTIYHLKRYPGIRITISRYGNGASWCRTINDQIHSDTASRNPYGQQLPGDIGSGPGNNIENPVFVVNKVDIMAIKPAYISLDCFEVYYILLCVNYFDTNKTICWCLARYSYTAWNCNIIRI
jgi:crotonobetainyl-CoA:carnitine CoA-transferase CaiB-like acyl-CoA transferase